MTSDKKETKTFISRMPSKTHKQLRFVAMFTGMTMQDIANYAIVKEIEKFKKDIPALADMCNRDNSNDNIENVDVEDTPHK